VPNAAKLTRRVAIASKPISIELALGTVEAPKGESFQGGAKRLVLEAGSRQVTLVGKDGTHAVTVVVKAGATVVAR
jgi:hypothetical protein